MVKIAIKSVKSDKTAQAEEEAEPTLRAFKVKPKLRTHDGETIQRISEIDPKEPLMAGGKETTLTAEHIAKVLDILPDKLSPAGFVMLVVNIMAVYDLFSKAPITLMALMQAISSLKEEYPDLFTEGGYRKVGEKAMRDAILKTKMRN